MEERMDDPAQEAGGGAHELLSVLGSGWANAPSGLSFRLETDQDIPFLCELYGSTRAAELAQVDWLESQKQAFVQQQFSAQRSHYRLHYPGAAFMVIECDGAPIGRIYVHRMPDEVRLMEVTIRTADRGQGIGSTLLKRLLDWSDHLGLPMTLHVEPFNPALRLYQRFGFVAREERGFSLFMSREVVGPATTGLV